MRHTLRLSREEDQSLTGVITIGRKGKFADWISPDGLTTVQGFARDGLTDEQIASKMGISLSTYYEWQNKYPELSDAIKKGKAPVDIEVENALLKRALGYDYEEVVTEIEEIPAWKGPDGQQIIRQKKHVRKITKHQPGEVAAQIFWLKNRRPGRWREKIEAVPENSNDLLLSLMELERKARS